MKTNKILIVQLVVLAMFITVFACQQSTDKNPVKFSAKELALSDPDQYVWQKFVEFFRYTDDTKRVVEWEHWINEDDLYDPPCDSIRVWPETLKDKGFGQPEIVSILNGFKGAHGEFNTTLFKELTLNFKSAYLEEARLNKPLFDYLNDNKLYLKDNVNEMAKAGTIKVPNSSAILKSQWKSITPADTSRYYWHVLKPDSNPMGYTLIGLVAFHLVTHELPDFVWSTFEHVDNPGRCDFIGCHDSFGYLPKDVEPNDVDSLIYTEPANMSPELEALFKEHGIGEVFKNYRLKASQINYVDKDHNITLNGNSVLEANIVPTSSCISCHARATVNATTGKPLSMFTQTTGAEIVATADTSLARGFHPTCFTGIPNPEDYRPLDSSGQHTPDSIYYKTNFLWQLAQDAGSCDGTANGAGM